MQSQEHKKNWPINDTIDSVGNIESNLADLVTSMSDQKQKIRNKDANDSKKKKNKFALLKIAMN